MKLPLKLDEGMLVVTNYNQVQEISNFLERSEKHFPKAQTVIVDDGSTDGSEELAEKRGFHVIKHGINRGTGATIRSGIMFAIEQGYKWVILSPSNGKVKPEEFHLLYAPLLAGTADYVTGSRFLDGGSSPGITLFRKVSIPLFSIFACLVIGRKYSDITCGFRAYRLSIFSDPRMKIHQRWLDRYEYEYYVHYWASKNKDLRIVEIPVTIEYSHLARDRISKIKPIIGWWSMMRPLIFLALRIRS